jgi:hypothetical protein
LRFLRLAGAFFAMCLLVLGQSCTSFASVIDARLTFLSGFGLLFGPSLRPLFAGVSNLLLLLAIQGDLLGSLDLLCSTTDL